MFRDRNKSVKEESRKVRTKKGGRENKTKEDEIMDTGKEQFDRPGDLHVHPLRLFQLYARRHNTFQTDHREGHPCHKHDQENPVLEHDVRRREFLHGERRYIRRLPRERLLRDPRKKLRESHGI